MAAMGRETMCILNHSVNGQVYEDMLEMLLVPTPENRPDDQTFIFQQDNASCHVAKSVKLWLQIETKHYSF